MSTRLQIFDATRFAPPPDLELLRRRSLVVGVAATIICLIGAFLSPASFYRSYLVSYVFLVGIALGCLAVGMLHHVTGGAWGVVIRRLLEAASRTLPVLLVLFLPITFGIRHLYVWARPEAVAADHLLQHKAPYLNVPFFIARTVLYFLVWMGFMLWTERLVRQQDRTGDPDLPRRLQKLGAAGLVAYGLTVTLAAVDWLMSLDPHWYSTMYGIYLLGGQALSAFAFMIPVALYLSRRKPLDAVLKPRHFHDWGKLLLAFVMLWAYFSYSQFLIIWSGDIPEEVAWYTARTQGAWKWVALAIVLLHFALPFLLLLSRDLKRSAPRLAALAALLLFMRYVDLYWQAVPAFHAEARAFHWLYVVMPLALGGIWLSVFAWQLGKRPLVPLGDPALEEAMADA